MSLDTVSALHLEAFGGRASIPTLDRLGETGRLFTAATTPWPETGPAHWSAMTGVLPEAHGQVWLRKDSASTAPTLAELAAAGGWATGAFIGGYTLTREESGIDRGFQTWDQGHLMDPAYTETSDPQTSAKGLFVRRRAGEVVDSALAWTGSQTGPYFSFVHLFNAHFPYAPDAPERFGPVSSTLPADPLAREERLRAARDGVLQLTPDELQAAALLYEAGIAELDAALEALVEGVGCAPGAGACDVIIVVMADHGESFAPEYPFNHRGALTPEVLRVPLVIAGPGVEAGPDPRAASLLDLAPTIAGQLGLAQQYPAPAVDLLNGTLPGDRVLVARTNPFDAEQAFGAHRGPSLALLSSDHHSVLWADGSAVHHGAPMDQAEIDAALGVYRTQLADALERSPKMGGPMPQPFGSKPSHRLTPTGMVRVGPMRGSGPQGRGRPPGSPVPGGGGGAPPGGGPSGAQR
ncbi:MAG: sulfatase-like hydrolase/transferase [Deltaproteobacteria bacterium]|nr:sulfatase-like hydrolase/transferase [Deltaproteobacteria bacterium]